MLVLIKKAINLNDAGVDRCLPGLKFHVGDDGLTAFLDGFSSATTTRVSPQRQNQRRDAL
jgi:hypothetical protein